MKVVRAQTEKPLDQLPERASVMRAPFMTSAMWFVWLLRSDIRSGAPPDDRAGQREFISWWLLWGRNEYPAVFSWDLSHAEIAMEFITLRHGLLCPRLLVRLHAARGDLQRAFPLDGPENLADYFCWYRLHGPLELDTAPSLPTACLAITEEPSKRKPWCTDGTRVPRVAIAQCRSVLALSGGSIPDCGTRRALAAWYAADGRSLIPKPTLPVPPRPTVRPRNALRRDGVNLVGFVWGQSGLGEDVRTMSAGLNAVGLPHVMIDATDEDQELRTAEAGQIPVSDRPVFATSVYCMSAFNMATLYVTRGPDFFAGQYRIGYCPWELNCFPDIWTGVYELMDEIWTGSEFTARAYRTNCPKPVLCLPAPVTVPSVQPRAHVKISKDAFAFTYPFDPNSCLARKNPIALVRAFRLAFPRKDRMVALLLRINGELAGGPDRSALLREIGTDKRIVVMEGTLDRIDALCLTASCDCLVSPHRAEGFGRNIAEAILLKVPVLATAFSGCNDFLAPEEGLAFDLQEVRPGQYPFGEGLGLFWAEPVVTDMAEKMKLMRATKRRRTGKGRERLVLRARQIAEHYAPLVAGRAVVARLEALQLVSRTRAN